VLRLGDLLDQGCDNPEDTIWLRARVDWDGPRAEAGAFNRMAMQGRPLRRVGTTGLALFALALQLVLSFGHIHPEWLRPALAGPSGSHATHALGHDTTTLVDHQKQFPTGDSEDDCPICLTMHMAASGAQPSPPMLFVPVEFSEFLPPTIVEKFLYRVPRHALFQTRAPPTA
jgi:hypothetical protein